MDTKNLGFNTKLIHAGAYDEPFGSAVVPIYQTSTFKFKNAQHGADCFSGKSD
jgi:O-acetylhomoserine/O-acetylserine sulfhydrylase-like pyridoxal-dependent enzyme